MFDPTMIILLPALLLSFYAQARVRSTFAKYSRVALSRRVTGAEAARRILDGAGLGAVGIERVQGELGDHYDPRARTLRLSTEVHDRASVSAVGVAAHEAGHAIQHDSGFAPLAIRNAFVPVAQFGSNAAWLLFLGGFFFNATGLMTVGILVFTGVVGFYLITLPVEYNASGRAMALLTEGGLITETEGKGVRAVLNAAALTYLAATLMAVLTLVRMLILRDRRD
jgi:Zn-dependent membrane protease YugP